MGLFNELFGGFAGAGGFGMGQAQRKPAFGHTPAALQNRYHLGQVLFGMQNQLNARDMFDPSRAEQSAFSSALSRAQLFAPTAKPDPLIAAAEQELKDCLGVTSLYDPNHLWD